MSEHVIPIKRAGRGLQFAINVGPGVIFSGLPTEDIERIQREVGEHLRTLSADLYKDLDGIDPGVMLVHEDVVFRVNTSWETRVLSPHEAEPELPEGVIPDLRETMRQTPLPSGVALSIVIAVNPPTPPPADEGWVEIGTEETV